MGIRRSVLVALSQSYVIMGLQLITSVIIARLLTPHELGIFSVAMVLSAVVNNLRDFGVVNYIVQEKELTESGMRSASTVTFVSAWGLALIVWLTAGAAGTFYREPGVSQVVYILAINFMLLPFGSVAMARMRREMLFERLAVIRIASALTNACAAVGLAYAGASYLALPWAAAIGTLVTISLAQALRLPGTPRRPGLGDVRRVFRFGSLSMVTEMLRDLGKRAPDLVLGRLMSMEAVAFLSRATGLLELFFTLIVQAATDVALPHFSTELRRGENVTRIYLLSTTFLTGLGWPFIIFVALMAQPIVLLLYGQQWGPSVVLVQWLSIGEALAMPFHLQAQLLIAQGRLGLEMARTIIFLVARLVPLLLLTQFGLEAVAMGLAASNLILALASFLILKQVLSFSGWDYWRAITPSLGVAATTSLALGLILWATPLASMPIFAGLCLCGMATLFGALAGMRVFRHPLLGELIWALPGNRRPEQ